MDVKDSFLDLERHRRLLEQNVEQLRKALKHWQMWEAEYEGLKEEIAPASQNDGSGAKLLSIARSYEGDLVTQTEIDDILGIKNNGPQRSFRQVENLLQRRIDYVHQNTLTISKQLEAAENKLAAANVVSAPDVLNEEGLPLTDIVEELDEDGNVVSSRVSTPGSSESQILEVLKKAGVDDIPDRPPVSEQDARKQENSGKGTETSEEGKAKEIDPEVLAKENALKNREIPHIPQTKAEPRIVELPDSPKLASSSPVTDVTDKASAKPARKSVTFAEESETSPDVEEKRPEVMRDQVLFRETKLDGPPVVPTDESEDDAALRRQMLDYSMNEVGAVVAELQLEEGSDFEMDDDDYDYNYDDEDESDDEEDEYGRSTKKVVTDDIRRQMEELQKRLGLQNVGPRPVDSIDPEQAIISKIEKPDADTEVVDSPVDGAKKSVRFADKLDIAPETIQEAPKASAPEKVDKPAPIGDIVERAPAQPAAAPSASAPKKMSRFKSSRASASASANAPSAPSKASAGMSVQHGKSEIPLFPTSGGIKPFSTPIDVKPVERTRVAPSGPAGKIMEGSIIERDVVPSAVEPDELDPALLQQEVAVEYHKMRNRLIQRQGGFVQNLDEEEHGIIPFTEEEGGPRKVSRFKAARLRGHKTL